MNRDFLVFCFAALMFSCSQEQPISSPEAKTEKASESECLTGPVEGIANVKFDDELIAAIEQSAKPLELPAIQEMGIISLERLFPDAGEFEARSRKDGLHRWYTVTYDKSVSPTKAVTSFAAFPGVEFAETIERYHTASLFNDPKLSQQWHYFNDGSISGTVAGFDINVFPVWEQFTTGREDVIVAVVDGGIDASHEDLAGQVILEDSYNFVSNNPYLVVHDHGTHVAGTIAAINNNGTGVCGIAGGDGVQHGVRLISCQVFEPNPSDPEHDKTANNFGTAIKWAADHGAVLCNNSWNNVYETEEDAKKATVSQSMKDAIDYFNNHAGFDKDGNQVGPMAGGVVFFSAGNETWAYAHPCDYEGCIAVGAFDSKGQRAFYSNYGDWVDIAAPGGSQFNKEVLSTIPNNQYDNYQGTSMACPHVTGVAALIVSYFGKPGFTREMLINRLLEGAKEGILPQFSNIGPMVDAYGSMVVGKDMHPMPVQTLSATAFSNSLTFSWKVNASESGEKAYSYLLVMGKNASDFENMDINNLPKTLVTRLLKVGNLAIGGDISCKFEDLEFDTPYHACVFGYDYNGNASSQGNLVHISTLKNNAPQITVTEPSSSTFKAHETIRIPLSVVDADGHSYTVSLTENSPAFVSLENAMGDSYVLVIKAVQAAAGPYSCTVKAEDPYGASSTWSYSFTVLENHAPIILDGHMPSFLLNKPGESFELDLSQYIEDPDGEKLSFVVEATDASVLHTSTSGTTLKGTAMGYGKMQVSISASDARGLSVNASMNVLIRNQEVIVQCYPNPVTNDLYIATGLDAAPATIKITSETGKTVYSGTPSSVSAFNPLYVDVSALAPGVYHIEVAYGNNSYSGTLVKN